MDRTLVGLRILKKLVTTFRASGTVLSQAVPEALNKGPIAKILLSKLTDSINSTLKAHTSAPPVSFHYNSLFSVMATLFSKIIKVIIYGILVAKSV